MHKTCIRFKDISINLFLLLHWHIKTIFFSDEHSSQLHQRTTITLSDQAELPPRKTGWQCRHRVPNLWRSQRISTKAISHALCSRPNPIHMAKLILTVFSLTNTVRTLINNSRRHYVLTGNFSWNESIKLNLYKHIINLSNYSRVSPLALTNHLLASTFPSRIRTKDLELTETTARALIGRSLSLNTTSTTKNIAASTTADQVPFR